MTTPREQLAAGDNMYTLTFDDSEYINNAVFNIVQQVQEATEDEITDQVIAALHSRLIKAGWTPPIPDTLDPATEN